MLPPAAVEPETREMTMMQTMAVTEAKEACQVGVMLRPTWWEEARRSMRRSDARSFFVTDNHDADEPHE